MTQQRRTRLATILTAILTSLMLTASMAQAHTPAMDRLEKAGWGCQDLGPLGWHCFSSATLRALDSGTPPASINVKVFLVDGTHETFAGTELLIRQDLFERNPNARPCPQDGGSWHLLAPELPYYACHHYDTGL